MGPQLSAYTHPLSLHHRSHLFPFPPTPPLSMHNIREGLHTVERSQDETPTTGASGVVADATMSPLSPLSTLLDCLSISSSHPAPRLHGPVTSQSISSPQHQLEEDDLATDPNALPERERDTAYGKVLITGSSSKLRLRLRPNGTKVPPLQEEQEQEEPQEEQLQSSPWWVVIFVCAQAR